MGLMSKLKQKINRKLEEKQELDKIKAEARTQAMRELKPELIKAYKEQELARLTGKDKEGKKVDTVDKMKQAFGPLKEAFATDGTGFGSKDKMDYMLSGTGRGVYDDKSDMLSIKDLPRGGMNEKKKKK